MPFFNVFVYHHVFIHSFVSLCFVSLGWDIFSSFFYGEIDYESVKVLALLSYGEMDCKSVKVFVEAAESGSNWMSEEAWLQPLTEEDLTRVYKYEEFDPAAPLKDPRIIRLFCDDMLNMEEINTPKPRKLYLEPHVPKHLCTGDH